MIMNVKDILFKKLSDKQAEVMLSVGRIAEDAGFNIYLIGGVVRDLLMNNPVYDIDIAVENNAAEFADKIKNSTACEIINTQVKLKTVKIRFLNGTEIDFASTREELYTQSGTLPEAYNFGCPLKNDVKRRDFTINTLAVKLTGDNKYSLIDYCGGYDDIKQKKIKILHDKSFADDPSRIIRALKFSKRFNFKIDDKTYELMQKYLLNEISPDMPAERVKNEFKQYFSINSDTLMQDIINTNAYKLISSNPIKNIHTERFKELKDSKDNWFVYFSALIINSDFYNEKLNLNNYERKSISGLKELMKPDSLNLCDNKTIYNTFINFTDLALKCCYIIAEDNTPVKKFLNDLKNIKVETTGKDLINLGFKPSPYFNEIFAKILDKKLNGDIKTKEQELKYIKQNFLA